MNRPWLLVAASAVTIGALFGWVGAVLFSIVTGTAVGVARERWTLLAVVALIAGTIGVIRVAEHEPPVVGTDIAASSVGEGVIDSIPRIGPSGPRAVVRVNRIRSADDAWTDASGDVLVFFRDTVPNGVGHGDNVRLAWTVTPADRSDPDFQRFVASENAGATGYAFHTTVLARGTSTANVLVNLREHVTSRIERAIDGDGGALIAGFVTGDDSGLSDEAHDAFELTNTSHITAVSGSNVAVLISMWLVLLPTRRLQQLFIAQIALVLLIWAYVVLVGMGPGAIRAGLFTTLMLPAARFGRKADPVTSLMLASAIMLLLTPGWAMNVGFWLSLVASGAIVTSMPLTDRSPMGMAKRAALALFAAQVATFPVIFWLFDGWSPASLVANLLIGPMVAMLFPLAFVVAVVVAILPWVGEVIGWLPKLGANVIISIVESLAGEFPMIRSGAITTVGIVLVGILCLMILAAINTDVRRWVARVDFRQRRLTPYLPMVLIGASFGTWIATLAMVVLR